MLKKTFRELVSKYSENEDLINEMWMEVQLKYTAKNRFYHTLHHLENLLEQLILVKKEIQNWDAVLFTLFYHDLIYNPFKSDNEEKSAKLAEKRLIQIAVPMEIIELCVEHILATKSHVISANPDTNYFTDADLSILGQNWETYLTYCNNVRKEYCIYPDITYKTGRKKVLRHFLTMERIFKTEFFHAKFENQAILNMKMELESM